MPFKLLNVETDGPHRWAVVQCSCNLEDENDALLCHTIAAVRDAYGENKVIELAAELEPDPTVAAKFDLAAIRRAIRRGLPDPEKEKKKPAHLTNYRSESCEMVAKGSLEEAYEVRFPAAPQQGKTNANQPILGFDHWGIVDGAHGDSLALVQVKGTEDNTIPPGVAADLAAECCRIPRQTDEICRTLTVLAQALDGDPVQGAVIGMLEALGNEQPIEITIAPVIVRGGSTASQMEDLRPCRDVATQFAPACGRGVSVCIGANLTKFGQTVMERARAA